MKVRAVLCVLLVVLGVVAASCGGGPSGGPLPSAGAGKKAGGPTLIIAKPGGIFEYSIEDGVEEPLIPAATDNTFLMDPALSADGSKLAYVVQPPPTAFARGKYDAGSDVWVANRDGSEQRAVFTHAVPNQLVRFPQWEDDGHLLAVVQEITTSDGQTKVVYTLERIDVTSGERTPVLEDALAFTLSPDGKLLAYARLVRPSGETLDLFDITRGTMTLVGAEQNLVPFNSPRFSPDGSKVAFASADQTGARAPVEYVTLSREGGVASGAGAAMLGRLPDGLPEDIWTVDVAGGRAVRVADLKEDLPALTWAGDGQHMYVLGAAGLYDVSLESGAVTRMGEGAFHGGVVWSPGG
jgi:dipeptidyl aminopeptidase/acylaminoacyl peptidase